MAEETNTEVVEAETVDNPEATEADKTFTQDELDHIVQERVKRAVAKAQKDAEDKIKQAQSEGERLAKLTKDERAKEDKLYRIDEFETGVTAPPFHYNCRSAVIPDEDELNKK